jgi:hypothetical protein
MRKESVRWTASEIASISHNGVGFQIMTHPTAYTAQELAAAQRAGQQVAKVVMALADGKIAMLVMPASYRIDFVKSETRRRKGSAACQRERILQLFPIAMSARCRPSATVQRACVRRPALAGDGEIVSGRHAP